MKKSTHEYLLSSDSSSRQQKLYCSVINSQILERGLEPEHTFELSGGTVGTAVHNSWVLTDFQGDITPHHCTISMIDGEYCLISHTDNIFVNHASIPLAPDSPMIISQNDIFNVGPYTIKTYFSHEDATNSLMHHKKTLTSIISDENAETLIPGLHDYQEGEVDRVDPLQALSEMKRSHPHQGYPNHLGRSGDWDQKGSNHTIEDGYHMDSIVSDSSSGFYAEGEVHFQERSGISVSNQMSVDVLMRGLGISLSMNERMTEMHYIVEEIGESLKEAIEGLLSIHEQERQNHYGLVNKNFQPIIDNPLHMGLSYEETVKLLYDSDVNMVHLAPPAAVKESLRAIRNHQNAIHIAITEALDQILIAFTPEALMRRFNYYRSARKMRAEDTSDGNAWVWEMYQAYYKELTSDRQTGFKKLFWAIFDQVYDREVRDLHLKEE